MRIADELVPATFLRRPNRFRVDVRLDGRETAAHLADPGRLQELLTPGVELLLAPARVGGSRRATAYTVALVRFHELWVSINSQVPNRLVAEALEQGQIAPLLGYPQVERERAHGASRFDFRLGGADRPDCWVEVKGASLVQDGRALFPDAPTARGARHMGELAELAGAGARAVALFVIQRPDAISFSPHPQRDPAFGAALRRAAAEGVELYAYTCQIAPPHITLARPVPVLLDLDAEEMGRRSSSLIP